MIATPFALVLIKGSSKSSYPFDEVRCIGGPITGARKRISGNEPSLLKRCRREANRVARLVLERLELDRKVKTSAVLTRFKGEESHCISSEAMRIGNYFMLSDLVPTQGIRILYLALVAYLAHPSNLGLLGRQNYPFLLFVDTILVDLGVADVPTASITGKSA
ncbi:hypothetical protein Moror_5188 [Moniliophthora roreri MCA 2997]|uniref:Uncharacterized protein n=1 Tax=Moniliophthora roreri (strain MCA 2997) TaxID=1381753 RepID=V2X620_MONRO|nr:hypothetical protein Moror_5188 [Moniliophthora roreri MCA 2997]